MNLSKGILTLAIGKKYNKQAKYLAYSCILHCPSLPRAIITNDCDYFSQLYDIVIKYSEEMGNPFELKLKLHLFTPFYETLFLDSDTLVYSDMRFMWDEFGNNSIVYVGGCATDGEWYVKDISKVIKHYDIPWMPKFNSGTFLFRKNEICVKFFNYAAVLYKNHEGIDIPYFRGKMFPDEPFLSIALAKYNQTPVSNDFGRLGRSLIAARKIKLDVRKGIAKFLKDDALIFPCVVHFVGGYACKYFYFIEKLRLKIYYYSLYDIFTAIVMPFIYVLEFMKRIAVKILKPIKKKLWTKQ